MSWLFSRVLVEEYLEGTCSVGEPFAPSSVTPTPQAYLSPDKMTAFSRPSRFGTTFAPLTDDRGAELLMWFLAGFPARTSAPPEKVLASTESEVVYGEKWRELSVRYDRGSCSWKTHRSLWDEDLSACSLTLPKWGSMRDGVLSELLTLERPTAEKGRGLWATPTATDGTRGGTITEKMTGVSLAQMVKTPLRWPTPTASEHTGPGHAAQGEVNLRTAVAMWPTPKANDAEKRGNFDATNPRNGLPAAVKLCPTPLATDGSKGGPNQKGGKGDLRLASAVHQFPTPTATNTKAHHMRGADNGKEREARSYGATGQLNPTWVEKLMGWPEDWTSLQPISHVKMLFWLMGMCDGTETRRSEVLRVLRIGDAAQEIQRAIGRHVGVPEAAILLAELCEHANRPDEARVFMACAEALEEEVRGMRICQGATGAPRQPRQDQQRTGEHSDAMQALSRLLAYHGQTYWQDGRWEDAVPRVAHGVAARVDRLKAIGNGQVPQCAAAAWRILTGRCEHGN